MLQNLYPRQYFWDTRFLTTLLCWNIVAECAILSWSGVQHSVTEIFKHPQASPIPPTQTIQASSAQLSNASPGYLFCDQLQLDLSAMPQIFIFPFRSGYYGVLRTTKSKKGFPFSLSLGYWKMLIAKFSNVTRETINFLGTRDPWSCSSVKCECKALHWGLIKHPLQVWSVMSLSRLLPISSPPVPSLFAINTSTLLMARLRKTVVIVETSLSSQETLLSVSGELKHCAGFHWSDSNKLLEFWECFRSVIGVLTKYSSPSPCVSEEWITADRSSGMFVESLEEDGDGPGIHYRNMDICKHYTAIIWRRGSAVLLSEIPH